MRLMTQNSWVDLKEIKENPSKETSIAMDFPHTVTVMWPLLMLHSDVLVETFNANLDQSHVQHLGQWQETLTLLHSNKLALRCNEQLQLLVLK